MFAENITTDCSITHINLSSMKCIDCNTNTNTYIVIYEKQSFYKIRLIKYDINVASDTHKENLSSSQVSIRSDTHKENLAQVSIKSDIHKYPLSCSQVSKKYTASLKGLTKYEVTPHVCATQYMQGPNNWSNLCITCFDKLKFKEKVLYKKCFNCKCHIESNEINSVPFIINHLGRAYLLGIKYPNNGIKYILKEYYRQNYEDTFNNSYCCLDGHWGRDDEVKYVTKHFEVEGVCNSYYCGECFKEVGRKVLTAEGLVS